MIIGIHRNYFQPTFNNREVLFLIKFYVTVIFIRTIFMIKMDRKWNIYW